MLKDKSSILKNKVNKPQRLQFHKKTNLSSHSQIIKSNFQFEAEEKKLDKEKNFKEKGESDMEIENEPDDLSQVRMTNL